MEAVAHPSAIAAKSNVGFLKAAGCGLFPREPALVLCKSTSSRALHRREKNGGVEPGPAGALSRRP